MGKGTVLGMVLSAKPIGESDKRLVLLTKEKGKISAFARGASKPNSPLLGCGQPFAFGEFEIYEGRNSFTIHSANVTDYFPEMRKDLEKLYYGLYFCEMADYFTRENMDVEETLKLLYQSIKSLTKGILPDELVRYIYEWKTMVINGEAPVVSHCVECKKKESLSVFSKRRNGLICSGCHEIQTYEGDAKILDSTVYTLQFMTNTPIPSLFSFKVTERVMEQLKVCASAYLAYQQNFKFRSLDQLEQMKEDIKILHEGEHGKNKSTNYS